MFPRETSYFLRVVARLDDDSDESDYEDFEEAQKLIDFAKTVKGIDKAGMELAQALLFEATPILWW